MSRQAYYRIANRLKLKKDFSFRMLLESLDYDPRNPHSDRLILLEDILSKNETGLANIFKEVRGITIWEIAFNELTKIPPQIIRDNASIIDRIFKNAVRGKYKDKSKTVINSIRTLISKTKSGLSLELHIMSLQDERIDIQNRTRLAISFTEVDACGEFFNWERVNLNDAPWLLPAFLYYYAKKNSLFAFTQFYEVSERPPDEVIKHISIPLSLTMKQLLIIDQKLPEYADVIAKFKNAWQNTFVNNIIKTDQVLIKFLVQHPVKKPVARQVHEIILEVIEEIDVKGTKKRLTRKIKDVSIEIGAAGSEN